VETFPQSSADNHSTILELVSKVSLASNMIFSRPPTFFKAQKMLSKLQDNPLSNRSKSSSKRKTFTINFTESKSPKAKLLPHSYLL